MTVDRGGRASAPVVEIIAVGEELLLGETVDTNAAWLGRRLAEVGLRVSRRATVGDDRGEIQAAVSTALSRADVVIVTGGLGPTRDDVTKASVASLLGRPLVLDRGILDELRKRFRQLGYEELPERNRGQAEVPEGSRVLPNAHGTAPGLVMEEESGVVILLPGVPRELQGLTDPQVLDYLRSRFERRLLPLHHRLLRTTGIAESALAERVDEVLPEEIGPGRIAFLPGLTGVDIRLSVAGTEEEAVRWLDRMEEALRPAVEPYLYGRDRGELVEAVGRLLQESGRTLAVAESCTGGLIGKWITDVAGASAYFAGGVIAYENRVKVEVLGVDAALLESAGAVSEACVRQMAEGARRLLAADAAVAVTGIAGPEGGTPGKPVGTVWYASALGGEVRAACRVFPGDREAVRTRSAQAALALLWRQLRGAP